MADIESRKATVRAQFKAFFDSPRDGPFRGYEAINRAAEYFGLEPYHGGYDPPAHRDPLGAKKAAEARKRTLYTLAHLMAEVLFGKPGRGRRVKHWTEARLLHLGHVYWYTATYQPGLKDSQVAKLISEKDGRWFGRDPELIRQRLPKAKRIFLEDCANSVESGNFPGDHDPAVLKKMGLLKNDKQ